MQQVKITKNFKVLFCLVTGIVSTLVATGPIFKSENVWKQESSALDVSLSNLIQRKCFSVF